MDKKQFATLTIVIIIIFGVLFYFIGIYRPTQIRKACNNTAFVESMKTSTDFGGTTKFNSVEDRLNVKDKLYRDCLRYNGIEE